MDFTKIKVVKKLGTGMYATTYLIEYDGKQYAMKKQKILERNRNKSSRSITWREMFFYDYVNKMPQDTQKFFCKLYDFKIEDNCTHTQIRPKNIQRNTNLKKIMDEINASNICANFIIEYKGDTTLYDFMGTKLSAKQIYTILLQLCKIIFVMSEAMYSHNNVHLGNFMVLPTKDKTFEFMGHQIPHNGLQISAIDYGDMTLEASGSKYAEDEESYYFLELSKVINYVIMNIPKMEKDCRLQKKKYPSELDKNYIDNFFKTILTKHEKIIDGYAEKYLRLYPYLRNFYSLLKKSIQKLSIDKLKKGLKYRNEMITFLLKIEINFALDHPQEYAKITGWCSAPVFTLPKKDVLEILECKTRADYFKFFREKLK
jgi:hypothetical protein